MTSWSFGGCRSGSRAVCDRRFRHAGQLAAGLLALAACFPLEDLSSYSAGGAASSAGSDGDATGAGGTGAEAGNPEPGSDSGSPLADSMDAGALVSQPDAAVETADSSSPAIPCAGSGEVAEPATGRCYLVSDVMASWDAALAACESWGGGLVVLETEEENAFAAALVAGRSWIGASDLAEPGVFRWTDGSEVADTSWAPNQPDNFQNAEHCVELGLDAQWNDARCEGEKLYVCERAL